MFDTLCEAQDDFREVRRAYGQGQASYEMLRQAAENLLKIRREAEVAKFGKAKTKVNAATIASMMRS